MIAHYLQHVPFEGLGNIENWLHDSEYKITSTQLYESVDFPEVDDIDILVILGGPMSVNDTHEHQWLNKEIQFIQRVIEKNKSVLGICLGAQLIAKSMGADVFRNSHGEIGWFPVQSIKTPTESVFQFPKETVAFHWHGETFNLPQGAIRIAESKGCKNQAFQIGRNAIGLQFHLETTPTSAKALIENCRNELVDGKYIQTEKDILSAPRNWYENINNLMVDILTYLHQRSVTF